MAVVVGGPRVPRRPPPGRLGRHQAQVDGVRSRVRRERDRAAIPPAPHEVPRVGRERVAGLAGRHHEPARVEVAEVVGGAERRAVDVVEAAARKSAAIDGGLVARRLDLAAGERAQHRHEAQQRMREQRLVRAAPAPGRRVVAIELREVGHRRAEAVDQQLRAPVRAAVGRIGQQRVGRQVGPRGRRLPRLGDSTRGQRGTHEPAQPGVQDQRLRRVPVHLGVPAGQQRQRLGRQRVGGGHAGELWQQVARPGADRVHLDRRHRRRVAGMVQVEPLADAARPPVAVAVVADQRPGVVGRDPVVGVDDAAARRRHDSRQVRTTRPAGPVVRPVGALDGKAALAGGADRHAAHHEQADPVVVGDRQVLHRGGDPGHRRPGLLDSPRPVQRQQPRRRPVVRLKPARRKRQHRTFRGYHVADQRAVPGRANGQRLVVRPANVDGFNPGGKRLRAGRRRVALAGRGLGEQVLGVGPGGGDRPGDVAVVPQHQERQPGCRGPRQHAAGRLDPGQIPKARQPERQMRVAGQQRRAVRGAAPVDRPGVARRLRQRERVGEGGQRRRQPGRRVGQRRGRRRLGVAGARRRGPQRVDLGQRVLVGQRQPRQLGPPVARQVHRHGLAPQQAVDRGPRRRLAERQELRCDEPAPLRDPRVDAARVGVEHRAGVGVECRQFRRRRLQQAERAGQPVDRQGDRAGQLGQRAGGRAPGQLHLEHAVARVQPAERGGGVQVVGGVDARHPVAVEVDLNRCRQPRYGGPATAGQRRPQQAAHARHQRERHERKNQGRSGETASTWPTRL